MQILVQLFIISCCCFMVTTLLLCDAFLSGNRPSSNRFIIWKKKQRNVDLKNNNNHKLDVRFFAFQSSSSDLRKILRKQQQQQQQQNIQNNNEDYDKRYYYSQKKKHSEKKENSSRSQQQKKMGNDKRKLRIFLPKDWWKDSNNNPPEHYLVDFNTATFAFQQLALMKKNSQPPDDDVCFMSNLVVVEEEKVSQLIPDIITIIIRQYEQTTKDDRSSDDTNSHEAISYANLLYALRIFQHNISVDDENVLLDILVKENTFWIPRLSPRRLVRQCLPSLKSSSHSNNNMVQQQLQLLQESILQTLQKTHVLGQLSARDLSHVIHHCATSAIRTTTTNNNIIPSSTVDDDYPIFFLKRMQKLRWKCTMTDMTRTFWSLQQLIRYQQQQPTSSLLLLITQSRKFVYTVLKEHQKNETMFAGGDGIWQPRQLTDIINAACYILLFTDTDNHHRSDVTTTTTTDENTIIYHELVETFAYQNVLKSIQQQVLNNNNNNNNNIRDDDDDENALLSDILKLLSSISYFSSYYDDKYDRNDRDGWRLQVVSLVGQEILRQDWTSTMTMSMWCDWLHYSIRIVSSSSPIQSAAATRQFLLNTLHFHFPRHYIKQCTDAHQLASLLQSLSTLLHNTNDDDNENKSGNYERTDNDTMCRDMILPCLQQIQTIHHDSSMDALVPGISPSLTSWILTSGTKLVKYSDEKEILWDTFHTLGDTLLMAQPNDLSIRDISNAMYSMAKASYTLDLGIFDHLSYLLSTSIASTSDNDDDENENKKIIIDSTTARHVVKALWACGKMISWEDPLRETIQFGKFTPPMYVLNAKNFAHFIIDYSHHALEEAKKNALKDNDSITISPKDIAQSVWALGRLQITDLDIIQPMSLLAKHVTPYCNAQEIANMLWGLAKSELPIHDKTSVKNKKFVSINEQKLIYAQKQQLDENKEVIQSLISPFSNSTHNVHQIRKEDITSQEAVNIMYALGTFRMSDRPTFAYMNEVLKLQISTITSQAIANTLWAHQAVNIIPDRAVVDKWAHEKLDLTTTAANLDFNLALEDPLQEGNENQ